MSFIGQRQTTIQIGQWQHKGNGGDMTEITHKKCSWRYTACSHTVTRTLWDHLPRISMTRFICKKPLWILMRDYNPKETFIIYFLSSFYGPLAHLPLARKLGINIQFQCTLILKVITAFPLFINDEDSTGSESVQHILNIDFTGNTCLQIFTLLLVFIIFLS